MMKKFSVDVRVLLLSAFSLLVLSGCVVEPAGPVDDVNVSGRIEAGDEHGRIEIGFSTDDRRYIHDYYYRERDHFRDYDDDEDRYDNKSRKSLPPGLAKRDRLPPGLQNQIRRNGQLPPGLEGRRLPGELELRLSPLPANYIRLQVGRDIVLMDQRTRITVDVIKNVFP